MQEKSLFAARLKELRTERGLSQDELGMMVSLSKAAISKYESGIHPAKIEHAKDLSDALGVSFNYLIGFSDQRYIIEAEQLADIYNQLSDEGKKQLYDYAEYLYKKERG